MENTLNDGWSPPVDFAPRRITAYGNLFCDRALNSYLLGATGSHAAAEDASDEQLIARVLGWALGSLHVPTEIDEDLPRWTISQRWHFNQLRNDAPESIQELDNYAARERETYGDEYADWIVFRDRMFHHWDHALAHGDTMLPGHIITNAGIEEDTLARIWLRVIRVHDFLARFTGPEELDGVFDPDGCEEYVNMTDDELLTDVTLWMFLHGRESDGTLRYFSERPRAFEMLIADESEAIRRRFGVAPELQAAHPAEEALRMRVAELHARYAPPPPISQIDLALDEFRRENSIDERDPFWTDERVRAAYGLTGN